MTITRVNFIIYINDQDKARAFYEMILQMAPTLHVPGMTEFKLCENTILGLMPGKGITALLENQLKNPAEVNDIPKCEIYFLVDEPEEYYQRLLKAGGQGLSPYQKRGWGDYAAYGADPDGNIIAFAKGPG